jgi:hypothetical protein
MAQSQRVPQFVDGDRDTLLELHGDEPDVVTGDKELMPPDEVGVRVAVSVHPPHDGATGWCLRLVEIPVEDQDVDAQRMLTFDEIGADLGRPPIGGLDVGCPSLRTDDEELVLNRGRRAGESTLTRSCRRAPEPSSRET